jgi:hypothetical protein
VKRRAVPTACYVPDTRAVVVRPQSGRADAVSMTRADLTIAQARQAKRLGILPDVLDILRLNERCEKCGEVPGSIECRSTHKPAKAKRAARQPWEIAA